jgi:LytS/YehU family sensor histidine kinase
MTLAMSVKLTKNWVQTKRKEQILEKEKLETELKFLKSQFNPHFLFNTINSIFVLIHKNPEMASESLAKFSDLLRYQLYECNESQIPLDQELTYLENFIELEKLRQDKNLRTDLSFTSAHQPSNLMIAPFVLMPFIENAFKHVSQWKEGANWITMRLHTDRQRLHFTISNSIALHTASREPINYGGIGLKNVQRRLDLLYPEKHLLETRHDHQEFCVSLSLELKYATVNDMVEVPA